MVVCPYAFGTETCVRAVDKFLAAEITQYFFFQRFQGCLLICIAGEQGKGERDPVPVHEQPHLDDRVGAVFLALAVFYAAAFLLRFKVIIRAVVVEDFIIAFS